VVEEGDRRCINYWKEQVEKQGFENFERICERALVPRKDGQGEWPKEDSGLSKQLYDIAGKVISSAEQGDDRVVRGGSWVSSATDCRAAIRYRYRPGRRDGNQGFRLCLTSGPVENKGPEAQQEAEVSPAWAGTRG